MCLHDERKHSERYGTEKELMSMMHDTTIHLLQRRKWQRAADSYLRETPVLDANSLESGHEHLNGEPDKEEDERLGALVSVKNAK